MLSGELPEDFENKKDRRGFDDWYSADETALKHLAVKNFVLFLTGRAGRPDATSHQQSCADRAYGAYDDLCEQLSIQMRQIRNEVDKLERAEAQKPTKAQTARPKS